MTQSMCQVLAVPFLSIPCIILQSFSVCTNVVDNIAEPVACSNFAVYLFLKESQAQEIQSMHKCNSARQQQQQNTTS